MKRQVRAADAEREVDLPNALRLALVAGGNGLPLRFGGIAKDLRLKDYLPNAWPELEGCHMRKRS